MKNNLLVPILLALAMPAWTDDDVAEEAVAVLQSVEAGWRSENAAAVARNFEEDGKVNLSGIGSKNGSMSSEQAEATLKAYFEKIRVKSLALPEKGKYRGSEGKASGSYEYTFVDENGKKVEGELVIQLEKKGDRWYVTRIDCLR